MNRNILIGLAVLVVVIVCAAAVYAVSDRDDDPAPAQEHHGSGTDSGTTPKDDGGSTAPTDDAKDTDGKGGESMDTMGKSLVLTVDGTQVQVDWDDNASVDALKVLAADTLTIRMHAYGGFEQTGSMEHTIASEDSWMSVSSGDIVLYRSIQVCLYHGDNAYDFTHLGRMTGMTGQEIDALLDKDSVTAVFSLV